MAPIETPATNSWTTSVMRDRPALLAGALLVPAPQHGDSLQHRRLLVLDLDDEALAIDAALLVHPEVHEQARLLDGGEQVVVQARPHLGLIPRADPLHGRLHHVHADPALVRVVIGHAPVLLLEAPAEVDHGRLRRRGHQPHVTPGPVDRGPAGRDRRLLAHRGLADWLDLEPHLPELDHEARALL